SFDGRSEKRAVTPGKTRAILTGVLRLSGETDLLKKRIDRLLVERGLVESREKAQALIMAGNVLVDDEPATKAGMSVPEHATIRLKEAPHPYVSRGGVKLEGGVQAFGIRVEGKVCLDVGSATGGFKDCLLLKGSARMLAL